MKSVGSSCLVWGHARTVFVGTLDMFLPGALNRDYREGGWGWPVDFGLFNSVSSGRSTRRNSWGRRSPRPTPRGSSVVSSASAP
jgi:hypothetical protein